LARTSYVRLIVSRVTGNRTLMDSYPPEAWRRLGEVLTSRRGQLGYGFRRRREFAEANGLKLSARTLQRLEQGERGAYPGETLAIAEAIYKLEPGSIAAVLGGGDAVPLVEAREPEPFDATPQCALELKVMLSDVFTEDQKRRFVLAHRAEEPLHRWCRFAEEGTQGGEAQASLRASLPA
jgi:transcriptional regulator with XRE-family HTH domain